MVDDLWLDYLEKLRRLEKAIRLTAFWTNETARATRECAEQTDIVVSNVRKYLDTLEEKTR